jgi:hypothetical protein
MLLQLLPGSACGPWRRCGRLQLAGVALHVQRQPHWRAGLRGSGPAFVVAGGWGGWGGGGKAAKVKGEHSQHDRLAFSIHLQLFSGWQLESVHPVHLTDANDPLSCTAHAPNAQRAQSQTFMLAERPWRSLVLLVLMWVHV